MSRSSTTPLYVAPFSDQTAGGEWPMKKRMVPMEVLVLGLSRTGTASMALALEELGYRDVYHMKKAFSGNHAAFWIAAIEAKYEKKGPEFSKEEWDCLLGDCMAVTDIPAAIFSAELVAAYPDAKVILTTRDIDSWYNSMMQTVYAVWADPWRKFLARFTSKQNSFRVLANKYHQHLWQNDFPQYGKRFYKEHNDLVRSVVPSDRLLEYQVQEGWGPLCRFLNKDIPTKKFPKVNDTEAFRRMYRIDTRRQFLHVAKHSVAIAIPFLAVAGTIYWIKEIAAFKKKYRI